MGHLAYTTQGRMPQSLTGPMQISAQRGARTWGRAVGFSGPSFSFVLAAMVLAACGCKDSTPKPPKPEDANPVNVTEPAALQEKARIAQAVATRAGVEPPPPRLKLQGGELATPEVLAAYNQELARLVFRMRDAPESLEELVRKWPMPRLPTAPAGKRIVYDPVYRVIRLDPP